MKILHGNLIKKKKVYAKTLSLIHFTLLKLRRLQNFHAALFRSSDLIRFRNYRANRLIFVKSHRFGEGNGTPLQYSCLENPREGGAWWAAVYAVIQIQND